MMNKATLKTDLLVCGLGPAGAIAAAKAAKKGISVIAIERNQTPGQPVQCAEFIPQMLSSDVKAAHLAQEQKITRMITHIDDANKGDVTEDFRGIMIDRARFDQALIDEAMSNGAQCRFSTPFRGVKGDHILAGDDLRIKAKIVIGADGPNSPTARAAGFDIAPPVETRQTTVDLLKPHDATDIFLNEAIIGGYAWLFPKGKQCNLGLGIIAEHKDRLKPLLEELHQRLVDEGRVGKKIYRHTGGKIPIGGLVGPLGRLGGLPLLLAGDAAGLTNPVTGAGINAAIISGKMAGEAAAAFIHGQKDAVEDYAEELDDLFSPSLDLAKKRRSELLAKFESGKRVKKSDLKQGWIAYEHYWQKPEHDAPRKDAQMIAAQ